MKKFIKGVCIAMIVLPALDLLFEALLMIISMSGAPARITISFLSHAAMLAVGIMGLKFSHVGERQKMLAGISGMQTILSVFAIVAFNTLSTIDIVEVLSIVASVILLVYYVRGAWVYRIKYDR